MRGSVLGKQSEEYELLARDYGHLYSPASARRDLHQARPGRAEVVEYWHAAVVCLETRLKARWCMTEWKHRNRMRPGAVALILKMEVMPTTNRTPAAFGNPSWVPFE